MLKKWIKYLCDPTDKTDLRSVCLLKYAMLLKMG